MKDEFIRLNSATPEEWDKSSLLAMKNRSLTRKLSEEEQKAWELETRRIAYGRAEDEDKVNAPTHYLDVPQEYEHHRVMDAIGANYHFSNAMKYLWRAGKKSSKGMSIEDKEIQDVRKSIRYLEMWIELRKESITKEGLDEIK
jgi:hypothetical protein